MKRIKLIGSLLVIVMLITLFSANVFAAGEGTITVTNTTAGVSIADNTYSAYKIFDVTYDAGSTPTAYNYTVDLDFKNFFIAKSKFTDADAYAYVSNMTKDSNVINAFATEINDYIKAHATIFADGSATVPTGSETCDIKPLDLGYYIVKGTATTTGGAEITSLCMLNTTDPNVTVNPKLAVPSIDKTVEEDSVSLYGNVADYSIGQSVPFQIKSKVPSMNGYTSYKFTVNDTMSAGLTFNNDVVVKIGDIEQESGTDYSVTTSGQTFHIVFDPALFVNKTVGADIDITYTALLNDKAVIYGDGDNDNKVTLTYSNNPYDLTPTATTPEDTVLVDTYKVDIIKYTGELTDSSLKYLADAHFSLKLTAEAADYIKFIKDNDNGYRVATAAEITAGSNITTDLVSDTAGKIVVKGIDEGKYYLFETIAPAGYNKLDGAVEIELTRKWGSATGAEVTEYAAAYKVVSTSITKSTDGNVNVKNNTGAILPTTGGVGTTIFTVIGLVLMTSVVIVFVTRKKLNSHKK